MFAILAAQGFKTQLQQYGEVQQIACTAANPIFYAKHKLTGLKVVIKQIKAAHYARIKQENGISESAAMLACHRS